MRVLLITALLATQLGTLFADEIGPDAKLELAIEKYSKFESGERQSLLKKMGEVKDRILKRSDLSPEVVVRDVKKLEEEAQALSKSAAAIPRSSWMSQDVQRYRRKIGLAKAKCLRAFDDAANQYKKDGKLDEMESVLDAKKAFLSANSPSLNLDGTWIVTTSGGYRQQRTIKGKTGKAGGDQFTWRQQGNSIVFEFKSGHREKLSIDPRNRDRLTTTKPNRETVLWKRQRPN